MRTELWAADVHTLRRWDSLVAAWVTFWLILGAAVGYEIWQLTALSESTVASGQGLQRAAAALRGFSGTPLIGDKTAAIGDQVAATGSSIVASGDRAGSSIRGLSLLIGLAIAFFPAASALALYLPGRRARRRDSTWIWATLQREGLSAALQGYLAQRAVTRLPAADVLRVSVDPHGDLASGRHHALAAAELSRCGITVPTPS